MYKADLTDSALRTLPGLLKLQAERNGQTVFLIDDNNRLTFSQVYEQCLSLATGLSQLHLGKGDRVAIYMHNCPEMVLTALAVNMLQAIWIPISTDYSGEWLADAIKRSRSKILVTETALKKRIEQISPASDFGQLLVIDQPEGTDQFEPDSRLDFRQLLTLPAFRPAYHDMHYGDACAIVWTSGTTGKSKGVIVSYNGWLRPIYEGTSIFYQSVPGDMIFNVLPLCHAAGWNTGVLRALVEGISIVIEKHFSVHQFWSRIKKFGATQSFTLGAMHMFLWKAPPRTDDASNTIKVLQAIPMPKNLAAPFEQRFDLKIAGAGYGQSECMMITTTAGATQPVPDNSIGFAAKDIEIKLFDQDDREVDIGEIGEIRIRPLQPHVICNGYFDDPKATEAAWKEGWFCTGDLGRVDAKGAFYFSDRKKDAVRYAGRNISTMEVESVVRQHEEVADVAAYGIPSKELPEEDELKIDIVPVKKSTLGFEDLAQFINDRAPHYFVPRYMDFVKSLPYTPTNKVQKFVLRDRGVNDHTWDLKKSNYRISRE